MPAIAMRELGGTSGRYYALLAAIGVFVALGLIACVYMETNGHIVTGMDNQIVWGMPHVMAVFLIVAASGALNVASTASVFGRTVYKPLAPLSALLAVALLAGGLSVLVLDLGRPERITVAMTHFNFSSIFAWNIFLYTGFFAIVGIYLWFMLDRRMNRHTGRAGLAAFIWRLVLTTGTGSIFGFLIAREAYDSALLAPMFIVFSFAYGTSLFMLMLIAASGWDARPLPEELVRRLNRLLAIFVAAALYFVALFHVTKLYVARFHDIERFILLDGGVYTLLFWVGQVALGGIVPLLILYHPRLSRSPRWSVLAAALIVLGGIAQMYVTIIGAQAYPIALFPGMQEASSFFDGEIHAYAPTLPEVMLGVGGFAIAAAIVLIALRTLRLLPEGLDNSVKRAA
jgi:[DsrC]-trisulfide reductase subunit P